MEKLKGRWYNSSNDQLGISYNCGHCGNVAGPSVYYRLSDERTVAYIYICPSCNRPTYINNYTDEQIPGPAYGNEVEHLPKDVDDLYSEVRNCIKANAYTASVLASRKLLMNVAASKGAESGKSFLFYVNYLKDNHFTPPGSEDWVDHIRKKGNEATHEIPNISKNDAIELLDFTEMLLRFVHEMPEKMKRYTKQE